jgi:N-methylhydantoinase B
MDAIELSMISSRIQAVCDEMGASLRRSAFSPNIKDRMDFSCAVFDAEGELCAQAAHIPVHLGSMAYAMREVTQSMDWHPGDMVILNDPYMGGTHLPDVTLIAPAFEQDRLFGFVANRAHHADIGCHRPGSMPISRTLEEEGLVIPPTKLVVGHEPVDAHLRRLHAALRNPELTAGDISAQISANTVGLRRLGEIYRALGRDKFESALRDINDYAETLARSALAALPQGTFHFEDRMDDDGMGNEDLRIAVTVSFDRDGCLVDFTGTSPQVEGNVNCPISVTAASVYYVFYCLMPRETPPCAGSQRMIRIHAPAGSLVNARRPAAVAAGNVETSQRLVDVLLGALAQVIPERIPAASYGGMNNVAMGAADWGYYETIGGGTGAHQDGVGLDAVQAHMTNTLNTPIEVMEMAFPVRIKRYALRPGSHGMGMHRGGDGIVREYVFLADASITLLTERRRFPPWGLAGGSAGACGRNSLNGRLLPGKVELEVAAGDTLTLMTPGGGGWGVRTPA